MMILEFKYSLTWGKAGGERNVKGDDDKESICMK